MTLGVKGLTQHLITIRLTGVLQGRQYNLVFLQDYSSQKDMIDTMSHCTRIFLPHKDYILSVKHLAHNFLGSTVNNKIDVILQMSSYVLSLVNK